MSLEVLERILWASYCFIPWNAIIHLGSPEMLSAWKEGRVQQAMDRLDPSHDCGGSGSSLIAARNIDIRTWDRIVGKLDSLCVGLREASGMDHKENVQSPSCCWM